MHSSITVAAVLIGALGVRTAPAVITQPATTYRTNTHAIDARWFTGVAPHRIYFDVVAWSGTETVGPGEPIPVAGANAGWSVEQPDGSFLPQQGCSPRGTRGTTAGFAFPTGAFLVEPGLQSAHLSLTFECFAAAYPFDPTGTTLNVVMDWRASGPTRVQTVGLPGKSTYIQKSETVAVGSATDGVRQYTPAQSDYAVVTHQISDVVSR